MNPRHQVCDISNTNKQNEYPNKSNLSNRSSILSNLLKEQILFQNTPSIIRSYFPRRLGKMLRLPVLLAITITYSKLDLWLLSSCLNQKDLTTLLQHLSLVLVAFNRLRSNYPNEHLVSQVTILLIFSQDACIYLLSVYWRSGSLDLRVL